MSVRQRIAHALAANALGQAVTIGSQLLLTPLFFREWGAGLYGEWLILSSVPAYLTMADMGVGSAAGNEMTMRAGAGDHAGAQQTYRGAAWVALGAGLMVLLLGGLLALSAAWFGTPSTQQISATDAGWLVLMLSFGVVLSFLGGVVAAGFRAAGHNARGVSLGNVSRLLEALAMAWALLAGHGPLVLCAASLLVKLAMLLLQQIHLHRLCAWLHTPRVAADRSLVRRLLLPSLGFMAFPLGNALALQGPILLIGHVFGGPAVAMFSAMRTLARLPIQVVNMFNASVWPEMSRAHGSGDTSLLRSLHRGTWGMTFVLIVCAGVFLAVTGEWLAHVWLGGRSPFTPLVFDALVLVTVLAALWNASSVVMSAINAHAGLGLRYVLANAGCLAVAWALTPVASWWGLLPCLVMAELILLVWVFPRVMSLTGDSARRFFAEIGPSFAAAVRQRLKR